MKSRAMQKVESISARSRVHLCQKSSLSLPGRAIAVFLVLCLAGFADGENRFASPIKSIKTMSRCNAGALQAQDKMTLFKIFLRGDTIMSSNSAAGATPRDATIYALGDLLQPLIADNDAALDALRTGHARGPCTGVPALDDALGGYFEPGLHLLQATTGCGKTAMALQIASDCQFPALYVSAEMPSLELLRRLIARQTSTFLGKLKGQMSSKNLEDLARRTVGKLPHLVIVDAMTGVASVDLVRQAAEALCVANNVKSVLIVLDSLHVWARSILRGAGDEYAIINQGVQSAAQLSALLNSPVLALCHRNRESNKSKTGAGLHAAKGSGDLEYESWSVLDLSRNMEQRDDARGEVDVQARFYKNRSNGLTPAIDLKFEGRLQSFRSAN